MKVHITKCTFTDKKKDGSTIKNKYGKTAWRVGIKTQEWGDRWINGFLPFAPDRWNGTEQELEVTEVFDEYTQDKKLKFELPKKAPPGGIDQSTKDQLLRIEMSLASLKTGVERVIALLETKPEVTLDDFPFQTDDLPE